MKNKIKILTILIIGVFLTITCKKDPNLRMPDLQSGVIPLIEKDTSKDMDLSSTALADFNATISVGLYYKQKPKSMDLMVCMNGDVVNTAVVKSNITSFPTNVDVTTANLVDILPGLDSINQLQPGDYFLFYTDVTLEDGTVINGNDTLYSPYDASVVNLPGSSLNVTYTVLCPYQPALTTGSYQAVSADWNANGEVTLTADPADQYTIYIDGLMDVDFLISNGNKLAIHVDPVTYAISGEKAILAADCAPWGAGYDAYKNYSYTPLEGKYNTCDGSFDITVDISTDQLDFGEYHYTFSRN
jgi:hypothetical protein